MNRTGTILPFLERMDIDFFLVASPYTLADQPALDAEFPACEARGVGLIIGQPFASGILATGRPRGRVTTTRRQRPRLWIASVIEDDGRRHGISLAAAALQFLHHPLIAAVIPGALDPAQMAANVATMAVEVPEPVYDHAQARGAAQGGRANTVISWDERTFFCEPKEQHW